MDRVRLAVAYAARHKLARKHIHGLDADPIEADRLFESGRTVFTAGIHLRDRRSEAFQRNTAPVITDRHRFAFDRNLDHLARAHDELVHRVVDSLLDKHVYSVVRLRTVAEFSDIHTRAQPDMLSRREGYDVVVAVIAVVQQIRHISFLFLYQIIINRHCEEHSDVAIYLC